jgi:succinate dehydrogenase/fumarate reductase flavoprotein subunit
VPGLFATGEIMGAVHGVNRLGGSRYVFLSLSLSLSLLSASN